MIRATAFCLGMLLLTSAVAEDVSTDRNDENSLVGKLGRPQALAFEGVKAFPEAQIRQALAKDFDVLLAADAHANLDAYLETLKRRLTEGYRYCGFPHAKVSAQVQNQKIQIVIEEGEQFRKGEVQIDGPAEIDPAVMKWYLTDSQSKESPLTKQAENQFKVGSFKYTSKAAHFTKDKIADFSGKPAEVYEKAIKAGLEAQGYFFPEFDAELKTQDNRRVDLRVHIKDPGPKASIGQITVSGAEHHTSEQILEFLNIKPGMPMDLRQKLSLEQKLKESHCFLKSEVVVLPTIAADAPSDVIVRVVEQPKGPFLGEELTEDDKVFVKLAQWLSHWSQAGEEDLVVTGRRDLVRILAVASPPKGVFVEVELTLPNHQPLKYTAIIRGDEARIVSWHHHRQISFQSQSGQFTGMAYFDYKKNATRHFRMMFGAEYRSKRHNKGPFAWHFNLTPALAIAQLRNYENETRIHRDGEVVSLVGEDGEVKVDANTGRVLSIGSKDIKIDLAKQKDQIVPQLDKETGIAYFQAGAFDRYVKHMDEETKKFQPAYNPQRPVSSMLEFALGEAERLYQITEQKVPPLGVGIKLLQLDAAQPLDRLWVDWNAKWDEPNQFRLPLSSEKISLFGWEKLVPFGLGKELARHAYGLHTLLVPPESGPAHVAWNLALMCRGRYREAMRNLWFNLPLQPEVGPLTCWYASRVFGFLNRKVSGRFARAGLEKLGEEDFRRELEHLLPAESLLSELVRSLGNAVRQLDDDEFARLTRLLGEQAQHPAVPKMIEQIRHEQGTPSRELLLESLATIWKIRGQAYCREQLEHIEQLAGPPNPTPSTHSKPDTRFGNLFPYAKPGDKKSKPANDLDQMVKDILKNPSILPAAKKDQSKMTNDLKISDRRLSQSTSGSDSSCGSLWNEVQ